MFLIKKFALSVYEQVLISAMNFLMVFTSAYFLSSDDFSIFVVLFSLVTLGYLINLSLFGLPLLVIIAEKSSKSKHIWHVQVLSFLVLLLLNSIIIFVYQISSDVSWVQCCTAVLFGVAWGVYETNRKSLYARMNSKRALIISLVVFVNFSAMNFCFYFFKESVSAVLLFFFYGINYVVTLVFFCRLHAFCLIRLDCLKVVFIEYYYYAKLHLFGVLLFWLCSSGFFVIASYVTAPNELGKSRAVQNMMGVFTSVIQVLENNFVPKASCVYNLEGKVGLGVYLFSLFNRLVIGYVFIVLAGGLVFYFAYNFFYLEKFGNGGVGLVFFSFQQVLAFVLFFMATYFRVQHLNKMLFYGHLCCSVFVVTVGVAFSKYFGYVGVSITFFICSLITLSVYVYFLKFKVKRNVQ